MTISGANSSLASVGLHIAYAQFPQAAAPPGDTAIMDASGDPAAAPPAPALPGPSAVIISQSPAPGHHISRGESIRVIVAHTATAPSPESASPASN